MAKAGFSTGCLYKTNMPLDERIKLFHSVGAEAIELSFSSPKDLEKFKLTTKLIKNILKFDYISVHAPWTDIKYTPEQKTENVIKKLLEINCAVPIDGIVIHPDTIHGFSELEKSRLPFLLENMDARKEYGRFPEEFKRLKRKSFYGFVFDIFHSYENNKSINSALRFLDIMKDKLHHIHVSGITGEQRHSPAYRADNLSYIVKILEKCIDFPKISEGVLSENITESASRELKFLKNY